MAAGQDVRTRLGPRKVKHFVFWDSCIGLGLIVVGRVSGFLHGAGHHAFTGDDRTSGCLAAAALIAGSRAPRSDL